MDSLHYDYLIQLNGKPWFHFPVIFSGLMAEVTFCAESFVQPLMLQYELTILPFIDTSYIPALLLCFVNLTNIQLLAQRCFILLAAYFD